MNKRIYGKVTTEEDELFYKITGNGAPLILIPGGGGDGDSFLPLADALCDKFKVITYDRRANARSTANNPNSFSIAQQSRDVLAILKAAGEETAFVVGNSSGGVIALELAKNYPEVIRKAIIHEPPLANFANNPTKWLNFFNDCYQIALDKGSGKAATKFGIGVMGRKTIAPLLSDIRLKIFLLKEPKQPGEVRLSQKLTDDIFMKQELIQITSYMPDLDTLCNYKEKLIFAAGDWTVRKEVWFAEVARKLSDKVCSAFIKLPGSHISFMNRQQEWATILNQNFGVPRE